MDVYDETPVPLPADLALRIEAEHAASTVAVKLLLASISVVLFDPDVAAHTADHVYAFLTLDEERRAQFVDVAGAVALRLENNGDRGERGRAASARPGLDFFRFEWPLYAYSSRRDHIVGKASKLLGAVAPGWTAPDWMRALAHATASEMTLESLRAWLENPHIGRDCRAASPALTDRASNTVAPAPPLVVPRTGGLIGVARGAWGSIAAAMRRCAARAFEESV